MILTMNELQVKLVGECERDLVAAKQRYAIAVAGVLAACGVTGNVTKVTGNLVVVEANEENTPSGELVKALRESPQLNSNQINKLKDFEVTDYRSGVSNGLKALGASNALISWSKKNQSLSDDEAQKVGKVISEYSNSKDGKNR